MPPLDRNWPDQIDQAAIGVFLLATVLVPLIGYWLMMVDIRAYLRALRGALVCVVHHFPHLPEWTRRETPRCLKALGLGLPCTEEDVKQAYRRRAEQLHPDRGGDRRRFHILQEQLEGSLQFLRDDTPAYRTSDS